MNLWRRFPCDTDESYGIFSEWLHTPARERVDLTDFVRYSGKRPAHVLLDWSTTQAWQARADAFDDWTSQAPARRYFPISLPMMLKARKLDRLSDAQDRCETAGTINTAECIRMMELVRKMETSIVKVTQAEREAISAGDARVDTSKLTIEQQRTLSDLFALCLASP